MKAKGVAQLLTACIIFGVGSMADSQAIEGGSPDSTPWVVLINNQDKSGRIGTCSASQVDEKTVVTAKHCINPEFSSKIAGIAIDPGAAKTLHGDAVIAKLEKPHPLPRYAAVSGETLNAGQIVSVHGFGLAGVRKKMALMASTGTQSRDAQGTNGEVLESKNGTPTPGDSGGPVVSNGSIVAVVSGVDSENRIVVSPLR